MKNYSHKILLVAILILLSFKIQAQELLDLVGDEKPTKEIVKNAFKSTRVINGHSIEFLSPGTMDFRILHRFGLLDQGMKNFYGLDQASMRMGFDFGLLKNLMVGVGRSTYKKEIDGFIKYAPVQQSTGEKSFPITISCVAGTTINTLPFANTPFQNKSSARYAYYFQTSIGRKFNDVFTLQVTPTLVHSNFVPLAQPVSDVFSLGIGGRYKFTKRMALTWDYFYLLNGKYKDVNYNPLSLGVDIETGGHVFQLHFSNATGMNERAFLNETYNTWGKGEIRWGFNLSRIFQIKKNKKAV